LKLAYLRNIAPEEWIEDNYLMLVYACDPLQSTFGMTQIYYSIPEEYQEKGIRNRSDQIRKKMEIRHRMDSQQREKNIREITKIMEEFKTKRELEKIQSARDAEKKAKTPLKYYTLKKRKIALPKLDIFNSRRNSNSTPNLRNTPKALKPIINDFTKTKTVYYKALDQMRHSQPTNFF